jgi:hypothetical protein
MDFHTVAFPYSPHPKPLSLRERGLKTQQLAFHPFSVWNEVQQGEGAGDEG